MPIGSQSYISRVGGDHVTRPAPIPVAISQPTDVAKPGDVAKRTRQALEQQKEPTPPPLPTPPPELPSSGLSALPGTVPDAGTVLISTFLPATGWAEPDWKAMGKRLPFHNIIFDIKEPSVEPTSPRATKTKVDKPALLNLGAESWMSEDPEDAVHAVTIRLEGIDDQAWQRMKRIVTEVERTEIDLLVERQPEIVKDHLAEAYQQQKRAYFRALLKRVPARSFLHYRLPERSADLVDASADRWAQRRYSISTKPLYLASPPPEDEIQWVMPEKPVKKRGLEPEVEFEMPVSLDQLDERVAQGAKKAVGKKVGKLKMPREPKVKVEGPETLGRYQKRGTPGKICEGCAGVGLKVWRRGPGGPGTRECTPLASFYRFNIQM